MFCETEPIILGVSTEAAGPLAGRRIGFYTSVVGMGGSEVLVADAMEAALGAGAAVDCWSAPDAAIRTILSTRPRASSLTHHDWPAEAAPASRVADAVATPGTGRAGGIRSAGSAAWRAMPRGFRRHVGFRRSARAFAAGLRTARPDVLFVNVNGSESVSRAARACGIVVVNCYHLSYTPPTGSRLDRIADQWARRDTMHAGRLTVHTSDAVRHDWSQRYGYPVERTRLIYNGVDPTPPLVDRARQRHALGLSDADFVFCIPGRLHPIKGHRHLIEAVRRRRSHLGGTRVLVCGDGDEAGAVRRAVNVAGLEDVVWFLGWRSDLPRVLAAVDAVVFASVESENLSVAALEALTAGTPVITTRVGGMAEAVRDGVTGLVVPPADADALGDAMARLHSDPAAARAMGAAARADALARFGRRRMMDEYVTVLEEAVRLADGGESA